MHAYRKRVVQRALEEAQWNITEASRVLDVARSYLYKLISAHGISRQEDA